MAHAQEIAFGIHPGAKESVLTASGQLLTTVLGSGMYYVMGFFVLSGYCIHLSVARSITADRFPVKRYMAARLSRILPLYYLGLVAALAVEWWIADARPHEWPNGLDAPTFFGQLVMLQNLTETFGSFASSWSITNEVFYYIFYGLLAWCLAGRGAGARPAWAGLAICVGAAIVGQGLYVTVGRNPYVYSTGMLFGLGMLWFQGALVALYGRALITFPLVRRVAACWPLVLASAIAWRTAGLMPHGPYLISGRAFTLMMLDFLASPQTSPPRRRLSTPARAGDDARAVELSDVSVPRPTDDAGRVVDHADRRGHRLAGDLGVAARAGAGFGRAARLVSRTARDELAGRGVAAVEVRETQSTGRAHR